MKKSEAIMLWPKVYDYLMMVLNSENLPEKMYEVGFKVLAEWVLKADKFLNHDKLWDLLFTAAKTKWFFAAKNIMWNLITKSSNVRIFENMKFAQAFKNISEREQKFLDSVVEILLQSKETFESELMDTESEFWDNISDLANDLLSNFEILIFQDIERAEKIFEIVFLFINHSSSKICIRGIEIFGALKETIYDIRKEIIQAGNYDYLVEAFIKATKITIDRVKRPLYQINDDGTLQDEDTDDEETLSELR